MKNRKSVLLYVALPVVALGFMMACGGDGATRITPLVLAKTLSYANPTTSGYSLQVDPATNNTSHLVLNLVGPTGAKAQGLSFFLTCDPTAAVWSKGSGAISYATAGTVFDLGTAPKAFVTKLNATTGDLQVALYQKAGVATFGAAPLVALALDFESVRLEPGDIVNLQATPGKQSVFVNENGVVQNFPVPIAVGMLVAH